MANKQMDIQTRGQPYWRTHDGYDSVLSAILCKKHPWLCNAQLFRTVIQKESQESRGHNMFLFTKSSRQHVQERWRPCSTTTHQMHKPKVDQRWWRGCAQVARVNRRTDSTKRSAHFRQSSVSKCGAFTQASAYCVEDLPYTRLALFLSSRA